MTVSKLLPRVLVIDDLFGRTVADVGNEDRADLCRRFRLIDVTNDQPTAMPATYFEHPVAEATFQRGQNPQRAVLGDTVNNDLEGVLRAVRLGMYSDEPRWALVLLDLCFYTGTVTTNSEAERGRGMPMGKRSDQDRYFGLDVLSALTEAFPGLPVVILSSMPRSDVAQEYIRRGAVGFLERGVPDAESALRDFLQHHGLVADLEGKIAGHSNALLLALRAARRAATHDRPILIRGERGTGKELIARYIHQNRDENRPFVAVNCGQFRGDSTLAMSALFGHKRGAFTGAVEHRSGAAIQARNGILFLDEISNLGIEAQAGLHRLLQEGEVAPLGAQEKPIRDLKLKLLAASNSDLEGLAMREPTLFMADLLDRLKIGDTILLPPLRERFEDLPSLVERFVREAERSAGPGTFKGRAIDSAVYQHLRQYEWPGNVREVEGCIKRAVSTFKHMEVLVPQSIELPVPYGRSPAEEPLPPLRQPTFQANSHDPFEVLAQARFENCRPQDLHGRIEDVLAVVGSYVEAVVSSTARPSAANENGEIVIQAAGRWLTGNAKLSATQAADLLKRLLNPLDRARMLTPVLRKTFDRAKEIRPTKSGRGDM